MLKVSGIYVSPFEVEATLMQHPAVLESAVIGIEDADDLAPDASMPPVRRAEGGLFGFFGEFARHHPLALGTVVVMVKTRVSPVWLVALGAVVGMLGWA